MATSPRAAAGDVVTIEVKSNGSPINSLFQVSRVETTSEVNGIPSAILVIDDGEPASRDFPVSDSDEFVPGAEISIAAGYDGRSTEIFKGIVVRHGIEVQREGASRFVATCADKAAAMTVARRNRQFSDTTDSEVIAGLIQDAGLDADVDTTSVTHESMTQHAVTDWDYVLKRSAVNGLVVTVADGKVTVTRPTYDAPVLTVMFGDTVRGFDGTVDAVSQLSGVTARAWDPGAQKMDAASSREPPSPDQGNLSGHSLASVLDVRSYELQTPAPASREELTAWADACLLESRLARIQGRVSFLGSALARPGTTLELAGLGQRLSGNAFITGVRHVIAGGDWETEARFGLPGHGVAGESSPVEARAGHELHLPAGGLQIAKVSQIHDDPDGERRILVTYPLTGDGGGEGVWVRIAAPYASNNAGAVFLPEVDDEVVLGFLGGDPAAAVVLGALHSTGLPAPISPDEENRLKGIVTRSQLKMTFDDVKKETAISTPGGHVVTLSDEDRKVTVVDSNANRIEMSDDGIDVSSPGTISISSEQKVEIMGKDGVDITPPVQTVTPFRSLFARIFGR